MTDKEAGSINYFSIKASEAAIGGTVGYWPIAEDTTPVLKATDEQVAMKGMNSVAMEQLVGKKVLELLVNEDQSFLTFVTDQGDVSYETDADCCSETWFADITGVHALLGGTVIDASSIDIPEIDDGRTRQDEDQFYGVRLVTDKGWVYIVYRNSSNGYYGGTIDYVTDARYENMTAITEDWSA